MNAADKSQKQVAHLEDRMEKKDKVIAEILFEHFKKVLAKAESYSPAVFAAFKAIATG